MTDSTEIAWVVVVPVKRAEVAKSRLGGVTATQRIELARAFPADCVAAALACERVEEVVVVTDDTIAAGLVVGLGATVVADRPDAGLNPALQHACDQVRSDRPDRAVCVLSGDLPALRPAELTAALTRAAGFDRAFLADRVGDGTTLLAARTADLDPRFGSGSREQHLRSGAVELDPTGLTTVRHDVDTWQDLQCAVSMGVGPHTRDVLRRHRIVADPLH